MEEVGCARAAPPDSSLDVFSPCQTRRVSPLDVTHGNEGQEASDDDVRDEDASAFGDLQPRATPPGLNGACLAHRSCTVI